MQKIKVTIIETNQQTTFLGKIEARGNYYLIIDHEGLMHTYPLKKVIINELNKQ
jgi:hypothetical protein